MNNAKTLKEVIERLNIKMTEEELIEALENSYVEESEEVERGNVNEQHESAFYYCYSQNSIAVDVPRYCEQSANDDYVFLFMAFTAIDLEVRDFEENKGLSVRELLEIEMDSWGGLGAYIEQLLIDTYSN